MNKEVQMGKIEVGTAQDTLFSLGIGSCLVITFYDSKQKIGALAHTMLPARRISLQPSNSIEKRRIDYQISADSRYADVAMDEMFRQIIAQGAKKEFMAAKLVGGANMFAAYAHKIGEDNISYAREKLKSIGIPIAGECVGGSQGRSVEFSVATGIVTVRVKF